MPFQHALFRAVFEAPAVALAARYEKLVPYKNNDST